MQFSSALQNQATDMFFSSVPIPQIPIHNSLPSSNAQNLKRYLRSKAWRDRQCDIFNDLPTSRFPRHSSSTFIKHLQDYMSANDIIIPNLKEGGVINSISALSQSAVLRKAVFFQNPKISWKLSTKFVNLLHLLKIIHL